MTQPRKELLPVKAAAAELGEGVQATALGLVLPAELEFKDWAFIGRRLGNIRNASIWWLADWLAVGYASYGALANEAAEQLGLDPGTLSDYRAVGERIEMPRRRGILSFAHHREVAYMEPPEQERWLAHCESSVEDGQPVTVKQLRELIRASRELPVVEAGENGDVEVVVERDEDEGLGDPTTAIEHGASVLTVPIGDGWAEAATASGLTTREWVVREANASARKHSELQAISGKQFKGPDPKSKTPRASRPRRR